MPKSVFIGEFEQLVLLVLLRLEDDGYVLRLRQGLSKLAGRSVSRGALYRTLERLGTKGYVVWELEERVPGRGGHPRRRYAVTADGIGALRASRSALLELWEGLDKVLG